MHLRSRTIRFIIILSSLVIAIIILFQLNWLQKTFKYERKLFNTSVTKSIKDLYKTFSLSIDSTFTYNHIYELPSPNHYLVRLDKKISIDSIKAFMSQEFTELNMLTDFEVSMYSNETNSYTDIRYIDVPDSYNAISNKFKTPLLQRNFDYLSIYFPQRVRYIVMQMYFWIVSSILLLTVLIGFAISIFYLYHQQFLHETQKDFVNNFSHEFKTPLSVISIAAEVLHDPSIIHKPQKLHNYAEIIIKQSSYLQNQLNRMLVLAITEQIKLPLQKELADINEVCNNAITNIQPLLEQKKGIISTEFDHSIKRILADTSYVLLAFTNILENAVKYSSKPQIHITTKIEKDKICILFQDNGMGIDISEQKNIFKKFYRVPYGDIHHAKGFGIGLNFVKHIIDAHKGSISVESAMDKGSIFTIMFPIT